MTERAQLTRLFADLGATQTQAETMAGQLAKRATQLASARGLTREVAMAELLDAIAKGRAGAPPAGSVSGPT